MAIGMIAVVIDGVGLRRNVAKGSSQQDGGVAEEMRVIVGTLLSVGVVAVRALAAPGPVGDDGEEDVLEARLLLDVFDLGRRDQPLELGEGAVHLDPTPREESRSGRRVFGPRRGTAS